MTELRGEVNNEIFGRKSVKN